MGFITHSTVFSGHWLPLCRGEKSNLPVVGTTKRWQPPSIEKWPVCREPISIQRGNHRLGKRACTLKMDSVSSIKNIIYIV